jgi:glycosyltransferase involved in cell wall biosynthesis
LFLSTWFPHPHDNGSKIRVYHLLRALAARHRVMLISFAFGTADPEGAKDALASCDSVQVVRCDPFERGRTAQALRFFSLTPVVERPLEDMDELVSPALRHCDLVIASTTAMAVYVGANEHVPKVLEEHNVWSRWAYERYRAQQHFWGCLRRWANWKKRSCYEARIYPMFDLCTMVSELDRDTAAQRVQNSQTRVEVVPNGVDCRMNRPGLARPQPGTLVYNGALTYSANYDAMQYFLADIYPLIRDQEPQVSLTITGSAARVDLSGLALDNSVCLSGHVEDVRPLVARAWVCVVPIRQGGGTRLKILEAMALGTPVVSTPKGAEGLGITSGYDVLVAEQPEEFSEAVVRLLRDPSLREELTTKARRTVQQRYDWMAIGRRFARLVEETAQP